MAISKILALRTKNGITQKQLADVVGTSQQQIHRIETGKQSVRFDLAARICSALKEPMESVFPATRKPLAKLGKKNGKPFTANRNDEEFAEGMACADVDIDPAEWFFKYRLRGGAEGSLLISGMEKRRLFGAVQRCEGYIDSYLVFESEETRIILNLDHLTVCQFRFDLPNMRIRDREQVEEVKVFMADCSEPLVFGVDADQWDRDDPEKLGQFGQLTFMAEHSTGEDNKVLHFTDVHGEEAFFRAKDIAMIQIPLWVVDPDLLDAVDEETDQSSPQGNA